ncbi:MAG: RNA methyltransferase [Flavobacteriales bacterium]|nr:RNA methyltransferase [Flavobacteriales bacterium]
MSEEDRKRARALHQRKHREEEGAYLVQGRKLVRELLGAGQKIRCILATEEVASALGLPRGSTRITPAHQLEKVGTLEHGNEVVAIVGVPEQGADVALGSEELVLALDGVADPGNLGTVLRIADWFGISRVWCAEGSVDAYNPKCVQASMGSIFRVEVRILPLAERLATAMEQGASVYLADLEGDDVFECDLRRPAVLVLGSESHGLSPQVRALPAQRVRIRGSGRAESLNVAMAAAALCMEFERRGRG